MNTATEHILTPSADTTDTVGGDGQPGPLVPVSADTVYGAIEVLLRLDEFFRRHRGEHGGGTVHARLRAFCAGLGWHPVAGADVLLDQLGLYAWSLQRALQTAETTADAGTAETADADSSTSKETA